MWFSAIKLAAQAGSHIFKKRQETKMLMADAQMRHAEKMARGEEAYQGKLFFEMFSQLPSWFTNLWILVVASIYGIKGTQIFRNGGKK